MTKDEKLNKLRIMVGEESEEILALYLDIAGNKIIRKAYPYDESVSEVPAKYEHLQLEIATYLLNKRGAEGELTHSENGISRSYANADVPASMLDIVVPRCGVF